MMGVIEERDLIVKKKKKVIAFPFYENWFDLGTKDQLKIFNSGYSETEKILETEEFKI